MRHDDRGVTLPELLIAMVIMGIIILPLGDALIGYLRNSDETTRRMGESHDAKVISAYFTGDVQNVGIRATAAPFDMQQSVSVSTAELGCNATRPVGTPQPAVLVKLGWHDHTTATGAPEVVVVNYYRIDVAGEADELWRRTCRGTSIGSLSLVSDFVVVHNVDPGVVPTVTCNPAPCNGVGGGVPRQVTLSLSIHNSDSQSAPLSVTLIGQRRQ
jgi:prepilin-type N-terminal cleavage/methylation domain-containing protein